MLKKLIKIVNIFLILFLFTILYSRYNYNIDKAVSSMQNNALLKSHNCCAWYVMRGLQNGNCFIPILPASDYKYILPLYGFNLIKTDKFVKGDIVVFSRIPNHIYGHIAMYDGNKWIFDYIQKGIIVNKDYNNSTYYIYRHNI